MDDKYGFNNIFQYPSLDLPNQFQFHSDNNLPNMNVNQFQNNASDNNNSNSNPISSNNKLFNIKVSDTDLYIENQKKKLVIKIPKNFNNKISLVENEYEIMSINQKEFYQADSILGIFSLNNNKYLAIVTSAKVAAKVLGSFLFNILTIELIKITNNNATSNEYNLVKDIKNLFSTKNFYFSNDFDLSLSLYNQYKINSYDYNGNNSNKKQLKSKYIINSSMLKYFVNNNIPECFYSIIIYGYIGCKIDVDLDENMKHQTVDIIIIERYYKKNIIINNDIPSYVKEIELISTFKNKMNKSKNVFSFVFYINSESMQDINEFDPCKNIIIEEFDQYKNVTCILNSLNNNNDKKNFKNVISKYNENFLKNKIKLIEFTSDWDKNLYFDTNNDSYNYISFYLNNSNETIQKTAFWFIDINNYFSDDDCCFNAFIRFMWKAIQKEINYLGLNIDIGLFDQNNNNYICKKFKELIMKYHNDLDENKKTLYNNVNRDKIQETFYNCFSAKNYEKRNKSSKNINNHNTFRNNNNNYNNKINYDNFLNTTRNKDNTHYNKEMPEKKQKEYNNENNDKKDDKDNDIKKLKILCATWNIAGISCKSDYNITELFTQNIFYHKNSAPDVIVVGIQEIIKLSITSVLSLVSNQENVKAWTDNILYTIEKVYPGIKYFELKCMDLVGIYILVLVKTDLAENIYVIDSNTTKTGVYGTMGNKGFFTVTLKCYDSIISFGSGHFEAGQSKNEDRINTLYQLLNKPINTEDYNESLTFKDAEYWIILGDLNFRIDLNFEDAFQLIREKKYDVLYGLDQFNSSFQNDIFLKDNINEKEIGFDPTYKYVKGSNEYAYDEDKIRVPAWTDRIFYCKKKGIKMLTYDSIKNMRYSDHRPVIGTFLIKCRNKPNKKVEQKKNENLYEIPYENVFKEEKSSKNKNNMNKDLIDIDNNYIHQLKDINFSGGKKIKDNTNNKNMPKSAQNNKSKNNKNDEQIKMNYRGINFNTEIDILANKNNNIIGYNKEDNNKQDIYQFFEDKNKSNKKNNSFPFNNNNNNSRQNPNILFDSFNNNINNNNLNNNNDVFNYFENNNQRLFGDNSGNKNNYQNNNNNFNFNNQNNFQNNNNMNFFQ